MRFLLLSFLALATVGCELVGLSAASSSSADEPSFGEAYTVSEAIRPSLLGSRLTVVVEYGGGCAEHAFDLQSDVDAETASVWFVHDANGDSCEALVSDSLEAEVPDDVAEAPRVHLLRPNGAPIVLR